MSVGAEFGLTNGHTPTSPQACDVLRAELRALGGLVAETQGNPDPLGDEAHRQHLLSKYAGVSPVLGNRAIE